MSTISGIGNIYISVVAKRAQEMLMFGNQQNRQAESNTGGSSYSSTAEKSEYPILRTDTFRYFNYSNLLFFVPGTLSSSGLGGLKAALVEEEKSSRSNTPNNAMYDRDSFSPYEKNYE